MVNDREDVQIMRVIMEDLPTALATDMIRQAVKEDRVYRDLKSPSGQASRAGTPGLVPTCQCGRSWQ